MYILDPLFAWQVLRFALSKWFVDLGCVRGGLAQMGPRTTGDLVHRIVPISSREKVLAAMRFQASNVLKKLPSSSASDHEEGVSRPLLARADAQASVLGHVHTHTGGCTHGLEGGWVAGWAVGRVGE